MKNIKWIWLYIKNQKFLYFSCILLLVIESVVEIFSIKMQQYIIDEVIMSGEYDKLWIYIPIISLLYLVFTVLFVVNPYIQSKIHGRIKYQLKKKALSHFYKIPLKKMQQERDAKYVHYFSNEIPIVARLIGEDIADIVKYGFNTLLIFVLIVYSAPSILIGIIIFSIIYLLIGHKFNRKQINLWKEIQNKKSEFLVTLEEGITSTRDIIAANSHEWESKRFNNKYKSYFQSIMAEGKLKIQQVYSMESLTLGGQLFVLGYGGYLVLNDTITIGTLIVTFQLSSTLIESLLKLYNLIFTFSGKLASVENIKNWLEVPDLKGGNKKFNEPIEQLSLENINFRHIGSDDYVLRNLSMNIPIGKKVAIVGPSGSGKSTIASLLTKFIDAETGIVKVNGRNLHNIPDTDWRMKTSVVFQDGYIFPGSIKDNLLLGYCISEEKLKEFCELMQIQRLIDKLPNNLESKIGERGVTISGGEKQRLSLVRAILRDPEILILDESTSALDIYTEKKIQENIDKIREGKTTIIIAHRLSTIKNADVIYVINNGELCEIGSHLELLKNKSIYASLVNKEIEFLSKKA
ncbi:MULTISPECIES: ABC transporter ATP-binding protein [Cytobacillus]|uniref:ABC transporter ATP-binding protein n=1 Tax=Cytobacillus oceanisediminis TaxID=665099 RepID=A0ABX3CKD1_9BACI|nr:MULTISPECIES: ABC transporter ATP-binding protein [Cytobacillus]OHX40705.1 hypothetical protein BBV17_29070 [Cytobacillus oceanisediminis]